MHITARGQRHPGVFHLAADRRQDRPDRQGRPKCHAPPCGPSRQSHPGQNHRFHPPWRIRRSLSPSFTREPNRRRESIPRPGRPSLLACLARMTGTVPTGLAEASRLAPAVINPPSGAVVGLFTRLRNRPVRPFWTNDSARFHEMSARDPTELTLQNSRSSRHCIDACNHQSDPISSQLSRSETISWVEWHRGI